MFCLDPDQAQHYVGPNLGIKEMQISSQQIIVCKDRINCLIRERVGGGDGGGGGGGRKLLIT